MIEPLKAEDFGGGRAGEFLRAQQGAAIAKLNELARLANRPFKVANQHGSVSETDEEISIEIVIVRRVLFPR